ncbi:MAG: transposase [Gemmataceae bacterium]|nr:transposase [Gemmataceae bacterium]
MARPLAYFITFSTYGTWLHGTDKGLGSVDDQNNAYGSPFLSPDKLRSEKALARMTQPAYQLDEPRRAVVRDAIVELARDRSFRLWAAHVRSNHVHVVISADRDVDRLMSDIKARASRNLNLAGFENNERKRWTLHGSTKYLFDRASLDARVHYTLYEQGLPMAVYDGIHEPENEKEPRTK